MLLISVDTMEDIQAEASAAHAKHGEHSMYYGTNERRFAILAEEVGEIAHEINEHVLGHVGSVVYTANLRNELTQVAAMAATWLEALRK